MPITNLNNKHLSDAKMKAIDETISQLETQLQELDINLTPQERSQYGTINETNKLLVNKVRDFRRDNPAQSVPDLDWEEFERDFHSRQFLESSLNRLNSLRDRVMNAKILHDYDNYQAALEDYAWTKYRAGTSAPGYETKYTELKQFFNRTGTKKITGSTPTPPII